MDRCPITGFDCISCDTACLLKARREQADPLRRGNELRTCDAELARLGLAQPKALRTQKDEENE